MGPVRSTVLRQVVGTDGLCHKRVAKRAEKPGRTRRRADEDAGSEARVRLCRSRAGGPPAGWDARRRRSTAPITARRRERSATGDVR